MITHSGKYARYPLNSLEVTTNIGCKLNCRFCPQEAALEGYYGKEGDTPPAMLSFENFKKIHSRVQAGGIVSFSGISEPLVNPDAIRMIRYAHEKGTKIDLFSTLTASSIEQLSLLKDISFHNLVIHIPDAEGNAKFIITDEYLASLTYATNTLPVTAFNCHGATHPSVQDIVGKTCLRVVTSMHDRAGSVSDPAVQRSQRVHGRITCVFDPIKAADYFEQFSRHSLSVRPDGRLVPCCMDFGMKHVLGNLLTHSWEEIQRSKVYHEFMESFSEDRNTLCRTCPSAVPVAKLPSHKLKTLLHGKGEALVQRDTTGILQKIRKAPCIGIMGLGGIFERLYFISLWDEAFRAVVFVDNNKELWGKPYKGIPLPSESGVVENPAALQKYPGIFVVTFVGNDEELGRQLDSMEIEHANIFKIFEMIT